LWSVIVISFAITTKSKFGIIRSTAQKSDPLFAHAFEYEQEDSPAHKNGGQDNGHATKSNNVVVLSIVVKDVRKLVGFAKAGCGVKLGFAFAL
jgi:hypothetical protein